MCEKILEIIHQPGQYGNGDEHHTNSKDWTSSDSPIQKEFKGVRNPDMEIPNHRFITHGKLTEAIDKGFFQ